MSQWFQIKNPNKLISPSLLVYPDRIKRNIQMMIDMAGGTRNLRPHIKTHKMEELIAMQLEAGIDKFKCATIAEAELLAETGSTDILLAMQPASVDINRFISLIKKFPKAEFSTLVDNEKSLKNLSIAAATEHLELSLWMDINNGMNRTGILPNESAFDLYQSMNDDKNIKAKGFHVYDGHIHNSDLEERKLKCDTDFEPVMELKSNLESAGIKIPTMIAGGTPSFPIHLKRENTEVSPGTPLLWDKRYASKYKDLPFLTAAVLFTRVISKPAKNLLCFDLGHKSVASEMELPRVNFLGGIQGEQIGQSEEHLVVESVNNSIEVGKEAYALPIHICPTVSKYKEVITINKHEITGSWKVAARDHCLTI